MKSEKEIREKMEELKKLAQDNWEKGYVAYAHENFGGYIALKWVLED